MKTHASKSPIFVLEAINAFATAFYIYNLFFVLRNEFGFSSAQSLAFSALNGLVFVFAAWIGGRIGQRRGYLTTMGLGFGIMAVVLGIGALTQSVAGHVWVMIGWTCGMCLTWANLEAASCDKETGARLPRMVGIYNVTWAAGNALGLFLGGVLMDRLGWRSLYWIPAALHVIQLGIVFWISGRSESRSREEAIAAVAEPVPAAPAHPEAARFLRMAWLANPFAYIAISTVVPLLPRMVERFELSPAWAGVFTSVWFFARMGAFYLLWMWDGWHYRLHYLAGAFLGLILCFVGMLTLKGLWAVLAVQVVFGGCLGLIYYSSLYYSMDAGEAKGEHGGLHEAALGAGICLGPALGAASIVLFPGVPQAGIWAVATLLLGGFAALIWLGVRRPASRAPAVQPQPAA